MERSVPEVVGCIPWESDFPQDLLSCILYGVDFVPHVDRQEAVGESPVRCIRRMGAVQ